MQFDRRWMYRNFLSGCLALLSLSGLLWGTHHLLNIFQHRHLCALQYEPPPPGMVLVPAGEFLMGSDNPLADPDEKPLRKVFLPAYYMDQFEVTNRRYKEFNPTHQYPPGEDDFPVTFVLKREAEAYCRFVGKRLPTSAEWEKAARGTDGRIFPWGNAYTTGYANIGTRPLQTGEGVPPCNQPFVNRASTGKLSVGSFPQGASPYGCQDMSGNVWEWVSDVWVDPGHWGLDSGNLPRGILRGGASHYGVAQARTSYQGFEDLDATCHDVGFRCARDAIVKISK